MKLIIDNRAPVYIQVIQYFKEKIASGQLEKGEEMPSRRELASMLKINPNTVQRAYKEMEALGLIFTEGNMPSKVTRDDEIIQGVRDELVDEALDEFVRTIRSLNITFEEILPLLKKFYEEAEALQTASVKDSKDSGEEEDHD